MDVQPGSIDLERGERLVGEMARSNSTLDPATAAKSRTRRNSRPAMRGVPRARRAISLAPSGVHADAENARPAAINDQLELGPPYKNSAAPEDAETIAQRVGEKSRAGGGADQRELGGRSSFTDRAAGPAPMIRSS